MGLQNKVLASRLGRADLGGYSPPPTVDPYSNPQITTGSSLGGGPSSLPTGRISAGMVGVLVLLGAGFYLWTRRHQS